MEASAPLCLDAVQVGLIVDRDCSLFAAGVAVILQARILQIGAGKNRLLRLEVEQAGDGGRYLFLLLLLWDSPELTG